jgi:hypothetical protein
LWEPFLKHGSGEMIFERNYSHDRILPDRRLLFAANMRAAILPS